MLSITYAFSPAFSADDAEGRVRRREADPNVVVRSVSPEDAALTARIRDGDVDAFESVVRAHGASLLAVARMIVGDGDMASDVVQDVFAMLWDQRGDLTVVGSWGGYLARSVRNRAISVVRHERATRQVSEVLVEIRVPMQSADGVGTIEAHEVSVAVRKALDALPPRCREIFLLNRSAGLSYQAIAEALGIDVATVHTQMYRATKRLVEAVRALE